MITPRWLRVGSAERHALLYSMLASHRIYKHYFLVRFAFQKCLLFTGSVLIMYLYVSIVAEVLFISFKKKKKKKTIIMI